MFIFIKEAMTTPPGSVIHALFVFTAAVFAQAATAADYPTKPVRLLVGFPPGGAVDVTARTLAPPASERLKQQVVVDNRGARTATSPRKSWHAPHRTDTRCC